MIYTKSNLEQMLSEYEKSLDRQLEAFLESEVIKALFMLYLEEQEDKNEISHEPSERR